MTVEDLDANRHVRTVLVRNWVNTQRLDYSATHGTLYVRGRMMLLREPPPEPGQQRDSAGVTAKFLMHLEKEILKAPGIRAVRWQLDGWQRTTSAWIAHGIR